MKASETRLKRYQRQYARKQKGSNNQKKAKIKLAILHRKVRKQRADFHHKLSYQIANENSAVICEDLAVQNMTQNHKLAKAMSDQGWSQFISFLTYKMRWTGGRLIKINRFAPSSQLCSSGGNKQKMPLNIRTYVCPSCGLILGRDLNAALNIKKLGIQILSNTPGTGEILEEQCSSDYACGDTSIGELDALSSRFVSLKQEKVSAKDNSASCLSSEAACSLAHR